jgi:Flp pilus assembly protein TadG
MTYRRQAARRRGAVAVESAIVYPVLFLLLFGMIVGGLGVFRYQQVACQAREAARYACVHGASYQKETKQPSPTADQVRQQVVLPLAAGMDPSQLTVQLDWVDEVNSVVTPWDQASRAPMGTASQGQPVTNRVRATVTYQWFPELFLVGPINLRSVSELPMAY